MLIGRRGRRFDVHKILLKNHDSDSGEIGVESYFVFGNQS